MKKSKRKLTAGESSVLALLLLCLVLAAAITGIRITSRTKEDVPEQFVELESSMKDTFYKDDELQKPESAQKNTVGTQAVNLEQAEKQEPVTEQEMDLIAAEDQMEVVFREEDEAVMETSAQIAPVKTLDFSKETGLLWPVNGNVILDYSMDSSIYFPTLKQYKYNPAIVISAEEGTGVLAGAAGRVISVGIDPETGTTAMLELGNGYTAVYGQLKEVAVREGDVVDAQDVIGYVSEPSKYYSIEGSNLYFELKKDGSPVDPLDYLK